MNSKLKEMLTSTVMLHMGGNLKILRLRGPPTPIYEVVVHRHWRCGSQLYDAERLDMPMERTNQNVDFMRQRSRQRNTQPPVQRVNQEGSGKNKFGPSITQKSVSAAG